MKAARIKAVAESRNDIYRDYDIGLSENQILHLCRLLNQISSQIQE